MSFFDNAECTGAEMHREVYRYKFNIEADMDEIEFSLLVAILAAETLHGESTVRLDARHTFDQTARQCVIDASTPVGRDLAKLFVGFLNREFGPDAFTVERVCKSSSAS
jgi:hypothetical protein